MEHPPCTVVVAAGRVRCGEPGVHSFTSGRTGEVFAECAEHVLPFHVRTAHLKAEAAAALPKHKTRTTKPFVLVKAGEIVGYAEAHTPAVAKRAARLGAVVEAVRR